MNLTTGVQSSMFTQSKRTSKNGKKVNGSSSIVNQRDEGDKEDYTQGAYLDIWEKNPSYHDLNTRILNRKAIFLVSFVFIVLIAILIWFNDISLAIFISIVLICGIFIDKIMDFPQKLKTRFRALKYIDPFDSIEFFSLGNQPETLFIFNKQISLTIAIRIFKIEVLPENVHPSLNQFLKALMDSKIKFGYQVIQKPCINFESLKTEKLRVQNNIVFSQPYENYPSEASIYFTVSHQIKGVLGKSIIDQLTEKVNLYSKELKSVFTANFHHTKVVLLESEALYNAVRVFNFADTPGLPAFQNKEHQSVQIDLRVMLKLGFIGFIVFLVLFFSLYSGAFIILISLPLLLYFYIFVWWRELLFFFSVRLFKRFKDLSCIDLFHDVEFFQRRECNDILFSNIQDLLLVALKIQNLVYCIKPSFTYPDKFFRAMNEHEIYYNYNVNAEPFTANMPTHEWDTHLNEKTKDALEGIIFINFDMDTKKVKYPRAELERWLQMRAGIWKSFLNITAMGFRPIHSQEVPDIKGLIQEVNEKAAITKKAFENNYLNLRLQLAVKKQLTNGFLNICIKNVDFNDHNTLLPYVYFQGKRVMNLISISNEFKKGVETQIAAEFNTPLRLRNFVTIGATINTEFLGEEKPLGFTLEQYKRLLITNGETLQREYTRMKIAMELTQQKVPCIIFDYHGIWSKMVHITWQMQQEMDVLFFKLGKTLTVNLSKSGIEPDPNNIDYLSYFYDTFALSFKEQKSTIDSLKEAVTRDEKVDLTSINLDLKVRKEMNKPFYNNRLSNLLNDFIENVAVFSPDLISSDNSNTPIGFITNTKTVILDLSILRNLDQKIFISFAILSQMIHYVNNSIDYVKKIIFIPYVDLFFDSQYIDNNYNTVNYGTINKFLDPLINRGFGFIFSANQIHYLHPNLLNYFPNIISFRATDKRDIAVLQNQMNLQELHGSSYYSSKRNNTYQIDYLKNLTRQEGIIKRADIHQPFPGRIDYGPLVNMDIASYEAILEYMKEKGYNLKRTESYIKEQAAKTLFEKDFGIYSTYIEEIINFLNALKSVDSIGNLHKNKLKKELLNYIYPKSQQRSYNKVQIRVLCDELFTRLVKFGYLVESHPKNAGGSESVRTSFQVGHKFTQAINDYYQTKSSISTNFELELLENEENGLPVETVSEAEKEYQMLHKETIVPILQEHLSEFFMQIFRVYQLINKEDYSLVLERGEKLILDLFSEMFRDYLSVIGEGVFNVANLRQFIRQLSVEGYIPLFDSEIDDFVHKTHELAKQESNQKENALELYEIILQFYNKLKQQE